MAGATCKSSWRVPRATGSAEGSGEMLLTFCEVYDVQGLCRLRHLNKPETRDRISENQSENKAPVGSYISKKLNRLAGCAACVGAARAPAHAPAQASITGPLRRPQRKGLGAAARPRGLVAARPTLRLSFRVWGFEVFRFVGLYRVSGFGFFTAQG